MRVLMLVGALFGVPAWVRRGRQGGGASEPNSPGGGIPENARTWIRPLSGPEWLAYTLLMRAREAGRA